MDIAETESPETSFRYIDGYNRPSNCSIVTNLELMTVIGCVMAVLRLRYRDVRHLMPLLVQDLFYSTPVV